MLNRRHFLAFLKPGAGTELLSSVIDALPPTMRGADIEENVRHAILDDHIPGIVCRPTTWCADGEGQLGFAFPFRVGEERVRAAVRVGRRQIHHFSSPWDVMHQALAAGTRAHPVLSKIHKIARANGVRVGLIGSMALQVVTQLPYVRPGADVDLVVEVREWEALQSFYAEMRCSSGRDLPKFDIEADLYGHCGVKLEELFSSSDEIMIKTVESVFLIERADLFAVLEKTRNDFV